MREHLLVAALAAVLVTGCDEVGEADDTDGDTDADCGSGDCGPPWGWYDETSGLCWQDPAHDVPLSWDAAMDYCDALVLCGRDDWRLPSISELRTFIRGCAATMPGGECAVTDECGSECFSSACFGCATCEGPGLNCDSGEPGGRYFDPEVVGGDIYIEKAAVWSSTPANSGDLYVLFLGTRSAEINETETSDENGDGVSWAVLCVRDGL